MSTTITPYSQAETRLMNKAALRILPFLMFCSFIAFLDRINIGFASLQMNEAIHLTPAIFGLGGGVYFISYFLFEVPSNVLQERFGARVWLGRIMIVWGIVAACTAFVVGPKSFLTLRFILGAAEAGFFPGVILYLTYWFPRAYRARFIAWFTVSIPVSGFLGSPVSAALLAIKPMFGLASWQWLYILEGIPAVILGVCCYLLLPNGPTTAKWLNAEERATFDGILARGEIQSKPHGGSIASSFIYIFRWEVLLFAVILAGTTAVSSAYTVWTPRLIKAFHFSTIDVGWLNSLPFLLGAVSMVIFGYTSDRTKERVWHAALPLFLSAAATGLISIFTGFSAFYILLNLAVIGIYACKGAAWALVTESLPEERRAAGIAQVNALSNLAGLGTVWVVGVVQQASGSLFMSLLPLGALSAVSGLVLLGLGFARGRGGRRAIASGDTLAQN